MNAAILIHGLTNSPDSKQNQQAFWRCGWKANPPCCLQLGYRQSLQAFITVQNDYFEDA
jgi:hypothetical protein